MTHSIHAPTDIRNPRTHVTHATIQPTRFSRNVIVQADNIWCSMVWWEFEKWRAIRPSLGGVGGVLVWVACLRGWCGWHACVGGVLLLLLLLLLKYYHEEKNVECLLLKKNWKNVPKRLEQWFKRRTLPEEQILLYIIWNCNYVIKLIVQNDIYIKFWQFMYSL